MNKKQIRAELAKIKIQYGRELVPIISSPITQAEVYELGSRAELARKGYIQYDIEYIEDDEGVRHGFQRGYKLTQKAKDLLEGV